MLSSSIRYTGIHIDLNIDPNRTNYCPASVIYMYLYNIHVYNIYVDIIYMYIYINIYVYMYLGT